MKNPPEYENIPDDDGWEDEEFIPCDDCDGDPACDDFGCAIANNKKGIR